MKLSYNWLKEYIDIKESADKLADKLTDSGTEIKAIEKIGGDYMMEAEITPNRSDCLSYIGIAREASALTGKKIKMPQMKAPKSVQNKKANAEFTVEIIDKKLCPRYTARLIKDVKVQDSPEWLKKKIVSMGLRPVNNVVDITNFALFETGQPMHAFDYDKIGGKKVIIRAAADGEKITSIDNIERKLDKSVLVIADEKRPIAIAGVMGGLNTEVNYGTKNILLESAYFDQVSVRRTSYKLTLISDSSYRFERGVDAGMVLPASDRAALLIQKVCGGKIDRIIDKSDKQKKDRIVLLRLARLDKILNLNLKYDDVKKALNKLSFKVISGKGGSIKVAVPSFRQDVNCEVDLMEEIARLYGYDKIAATIPRIVASAGRKPISWQTAQEIRSALTSMGLNEAITFTMVSADTVSKVKTLFPNLNTEIQVSNPLSAEQEYMRPLIMPGLLAAIEININKGIKDLKIFELGKVYDKDKRYETTNLCIAMTGLLSNDWQNDKKEITFYNMKGVLETLFAKLGLENLKIVSENSEYSSIYYRSEKIGFAAASLGVIKEEFDLDQNIFISEINIDKLPVKFSKKYDELPRYPSIKRDISLVKSGKVGFDDICSLAKENGGNLIENISVISLYTGKQIPQGHQGLAFRIEYRDKSRTLTSEEVDKTHLSIRQSLVDKLGVSLR